MATITPANLSYKDKDGDLGEVKSLTNTDVTLLNNALQDIEDLKLAYSPGFVKRDFSNVTQDGKDAAIEWDRPDYSSGVAISLTINTLVSYIAPSDGFIAYTLSASMSSNDRIAKMIINGTNVIYANSFSSSYWTTFSGVIPVKKNDTIQIYPAGNSSSDIISTLNNAVFYPCLGA